MSTDSTTDGDIWKRWLLHRRDVTDEARRQAEEQFRVVRDRVLDNADVQQGETLLDVGTGTGLIAFGAIERVGPEGRVIFSDISNDCLQHCRELVDELGMGARASFIEASAEDLSAIPDASVDVVTTRSVIIYVKEKRRAFSEFRRVLKPGGRLSMFEPINSFNKREPGTLWGYDVAPIQEIVDKMTADMRRHQPSEGNPMLDFDERDLIDMAIEAGFESVKLTLDAFVGRGGKPTWDHVYRSAPNPMALSLEETAREVLSEEERVRFEEFMRSAVEEQRPKSRRALAYLTAVTPPSR